MKIKTATEDGKYFFYHMVGEAVISKEYRWNIFGKKRLHIF